MTVTIYFKKKLKIVELGIWFAASKKIFRKAVPEFPLKNL